MAQAQILPLVSVIVPAYNAERFLAETLDSILAQTYPHFEVLVVDDGSTDRTAAIAQAYCDRDSRIRLLQQPNGGVAAARNLGIREARGEFIAPIDADDIWYPQNLEKQIACFLRSDPKVGVVYAWSNYIDEDGLPLPGCRAFAIQGNVFLTLVCHDFLGNASASVIRRCCLEQVGLYSTELRAQGAQGCEDLDLYLRLAEHYQFQVVPEFLIGYRKLSSSMSCNYTSMANSYCQVLAWVHQRHPDLPERLLRLSKGNFFMYLAFESDRVGDIAQSQHWLREALAVDPLTPFLRPSLYRLLWKTYWYRQHRPSEREQNLDNQTLPTAAKPERPVACTPMPERAGRVQRRLRVKLLVWVGHVFHALLPWFAGFYQPSTLRQP